jgi:hypothetical protein
MNKYNFFGVIAVLGVVVSLFGAWAKLTHQAFADLAITAGLICQAIGFAALIWFFFMWLKKRDAS